MPVLGVIFLRHATNRFEAANRMIEQDKDNGKMPKRKVLPEDYIRRRALWLPEEAQYDWIMEKAATSGRDLPRLTREGRSEVGQMAVQSAHALLRCKTIESFSAKKMA
jgi:type I restriction enzyme M protein